MNSKERMVQLFVKASVVFKHEFAFDRDLTSGEREWILVHLLLADGANDGWCSPAFGEGL